MENLDRLPLANVSMTLDVAVVTGRTTATTYFFPFIVIKGGGCSALTMGVDGLVE